MELGEYVTTVTTVEELHFALTHLMAERGLSDASVYDADGMHLELWLETLPSGKSVINVKGRE